MVITAKFASVCPVCSRGIEVGSSVEWTKGQKAKHSKCCNNPTVKSENRMGMSLPVIGMKVKSFLNIQMKNTLLGTTHEGVIIGFDDKYPIVDWSIEGVKPEAIRVINEEKCTREKKALCIFDIENRKQLYVV